MTPFTGFGAAQQGVRGGKIKAASQSLSLVVPVTNDEIDEPAPSGENPTLDAYYALTPRQ